MFRNKDNRPGHFPDRSIHSAPKYALTPPKPPPVGWDETFLWLHHIKTDHWWVTQMPIRIYCLEKALGFTLNYIGDILNGGKRSYPQQVIPKIGTAIPEIEERSLVFPRDLRNHSPGETGTKFLRLKIPADPPAIAKVSPESAWSLWARCLTCGSNKFLPVMIDCKPFVACYHCLPPSQHRTIGATETKKSLIHEALKKYY